VEEDDEVVAAICARAAAAAGGTVTPARIGAAWWQAFRAGMAASPFRPQRTLAVESLTTALTATGCPADASTLCEEQVRYWRSAPLRAGTRAFLDSVDVPVCILSNIDRADLEAALEHHGLSFTAIVTSEDVGAYKPSPRMFERGLAELGLPADDVLHVGDSLTADVAGARAAGIVPIWVDRRRRSGPEGPGSVRAIRTLTDLAPLLRRPRPAP
jgi:2-haloacid dehalogenase